MPTGLLSRVAIGVFALSAAVAVALYIAQPLTHAHSYQLEVRVTVIVAFVWYVSRVKPQWLQQPAFLWCVLASGLYCAVARPLTVKPDSELLAAYASAFDALDTGKNPYTAGTIVHFAENGVHKLGNFNYPPLELWPYYGVAKLFGRWDHVLLTLTLLGVQVAACGLLWLAFRDVPRFTIAAFVPLLACFELHTNVALTMLFVLAIVLVMVRQEQKPRAWQRLALWLLFGAGLMTKFLIVPLFATYLWRRLELSRLRSWRQTALDFAVPVAVALTFMAPFGVANVFRETVLFNLVLRDRAQLTTFYPNILSGGLAWVGLSAYFALFALLALAIGIVVTRWLSPLRGFLAAAIAFLLVSPTPEPQYVPVVIALALATTLFERHLLERHSAEQTTAEAHRSDSTQPTLGQLTAE